MCDITRFFIMMPVLIFISAIISKYCMQDMIMKFGLWYLVIVTDATPSKIICIVTCECLTSDYEAVADRNYMSV